MISIEHKFIFVHVPKTAGTTIKNWLKTVVGEQADPVWEHFKSTEIQHMFHRDFYNQCFKFTFVRNPWSRVVSSYFYLTSDVYRKKNPMKWESKFKGVSFEKFVRNKLMFMPQYKYFSDHDGNMQVDFVGTVEFLERDLRYVAGKLGAQPPSDLPVSNKTRHKDYRSYYVPETIEIVREHHQRDIDLFGYEFDELPRKPTYL